MGPAGVTRGNRVIAMGWLAVNAAVAWGISYRTKVDIDSRFLGCRCWQTGCCWGFRRFDDLDLERDTGKVLQAGEKVGPCNTRYKGMLNNQGYRTQSVSFLELPTEADSAEEGSQVELPT